MSIADADASFVAEALPAPLAVVTEDAVTSILVCASVGRAFLAVLFREKPSTRLYGFDTCLGHHRWREQ